MKLKSTVVAVVIVVLAVTGATSAFAGGQKEGAAGSPAQSTPIVHILINSSPWLPSFKALVALYEKETGNHVILDVTPFPSMLQKTRNATTAPTSEYDLVNLNEDWAIQFYKGGLVTPLDQIDSNFKLSPQVIEYGYADRWDAAAETTSKSGVLEGVPINGNIALLFYRKDLFAQKGLNPPTTLQEMLADAKLFADPPKMYGFVSRTIPGDFDLDTYIHGFGGSIVSYDAQSGKWSVDIDKKPAIDALKYWLNLVWNFDPPDYTQIDQAAEISLMASGRAAMSIIVDAAVSNLNDPKVSAVVGKIGATVTPGLTPSLRAATSGIWVLAIPHNLPMSHKKAAMEFLSWAATNKAEMASADAGGIPVREDVYQAMAKNARFWWAQAAADSTPYLKHFPRVTSDGEMKSALDSILSQVVAKQISPDQAMKQAAQRMYAIMSNAGYPMAPLSN